MRIAAEGKGFLAAVGAVLLICLATAWLAGFFADARSAADAPRRSAWECAALYSLAPSLIDAPLNDLAIAVVHRLSTRLACEGRHDEAAEVRRVGSAALQRKVELIGQLLTWCLREYGSSSAQACGAWAPEEANRSAAEPLRAALLPYFR